MGTYIENYYGFLAEYWQIGFVFWVIVILGAAAIYATAKLRAARRRARIAKAHTALKAARAARHNY